MAAGSPILTTTGTGVEEEVIKLPKTFGTSNFALLPSCVLASSSTLLQLLAVAVAIYRDQWQVICLIRLGNTLMTLLVNECGKFRASFQNSSRTEEDEGRWGDS